VKRANRAALLCGIYVVVNEGSDPVGLAGAALAGGALVIQYRAKRGLDRANAAALRSITHRHGALFIVNDDWRAALDYEADGVHLGPADAPPESLAAIRGALPECVIGLSCGTPDEARLAAVVDADYIGVGSVYATTSKEDAGAPIGIEGLRAAAAATRLPVAAIGGITRERIPEIRAAGVAMAAVISAIAQSGDPAAATRELVRSWNAQ